ncbi:MAG: hypothetical protein JWO25_3945 [Alphaproteobacteria bacterium]|nr:hypothetical protein [Alphaproteobacteria bacterium]
MRIGKLSPATKWTALGTLAKTATMKVTEDVPAAAAHGSAPVSPVQSVEMLVAMAAVDPERERKRRMAQQAEDGLDNLEALHAEIVSGAPSPERLQSLAAWAKALGQPDDSQLADLIRDIELRVLVELAKLERGL